MAGISDDHTASDSPLEWLFITTAIELVARYMPQGAPQKAAREFLFIELHAKRIRWRFHGIARDSGWVFPLTYFWLRDDKLITHEITADAAVIRTGIALVKAEPPPPMDRRPGFERLNPGARDNEERYVFDPRGKTTVTRLELVQLHQGDILRRLQERGFLPMQRELSLSEPVPESSVEPQSNSTGTEQSSPSEQPQSDSTGAEQSPPQPVSREEPQAEETSQESLDSEWDPLADWSVETVFRELEIRGPAMRKIVTALPELPALPNRLRRYRGKSVVDILDSISPADLFEAIGKLASQDSCEKFKRAWKEYRAKQGIVIR